ncbi:50S ribosomal protein L13 [Gimesia aquarii]|uniref:Large ribosomal subunit protein uL13 n=2 Tax=Gimesia aquarii TaxID=2527964 RepID=A0A517WUE6_9PLAN|nr:50S ribosomal protein L13 [Gimesia aquarii]QDU08897.1 50S ribosomal protein L13 [Gimesia aquarii]
MSTTKTYMANAKTIDPQWFVVDADNMIVGRLATKLATVLMGKHKPSYTPHVDTGDYVIVVNCDKVRFSGKSLAHETHPYFSKKMLQKTYSSYSGYPSGLKLVSAEKKLERGQSTQVLSEAVRRMLPKNKLGRQMLKKLKLYAGPTHEHQSQKPQDMPDYLLP